MTHPTQPTNFGQCWGTPLGQSLSFPSYLASGIMAVAEAVLRRWTTTPGDLIYDRDYGRNIWDLVSADLSPTDIAYQQQQLAAEALKDERVLACTVVLALNTAGTLAITSNLRTALGPFRLVVSASQMAGLTATVTPQ